MQKPHNLIVMLIAVMALSLGILFTPITQAQQPPTLIYGVQSSGTPAPVLVASNGGLILGAGTAEIGLLTQKTTYSAATTAKTATAAGTGPFFSICGHATTVIRLQQLTISGTVGTAAVYGDVTLRKTSTATSAGTATALTKVPHDSASAASAVSLLNYYTALATSGALVGTVGALGAVFPITGTVAAQMAVVDFDFSNRMEAEAPTLRGTAECIEAGFGTTTTNAPTLQVRALWTEE